MQNKQDVNILVTSCLSELNLYSFTGDSPKRVTTSTVTYLLDFFI